MLFYLILIPFAPQLQSCHLTLCCKIFSCFSSLRLTVTFTIYWACGRSLFTVTYGGSFSIFSDNLLKIISVNVTISWWARCWFSRPGVNRCQQTCKWTSNVSEHWNSTTSSTPEGGKQYDDHKIASNPHGVIPGYVCASILQSHTHLQFLA